MLNVPLTKYFKNLPGIDTFRSLWGLYETELYGKINVVKTALNSVSLSQEASASKTPGLVIDSYVRVSFEELYESIGGDKESAAGLVNEDAVAYYIPVPLDRLPVGSSVFGKIGAQNIIPITVDGVAAFVDRADNVNVPAECESKFFLKLKKSRFEISENWISIDGNQFDCIWIGDYARNKNIIEIHYGSILGVLINRDLYYKKLYQSSLLDPDMYLRETVAIANATKYPQTRVLEVNKRYAKLILDITTEMFKNGPTPNSIKRSVESVLSNYAMIVENSVTIEDGLHRKYGLTVADCFIVNTGVDYSEINSNEVLAAISTVVGEIKPECFDAILPSGSGHWSSDSLSISDNVSFSNITITTSIVSGKTIFAPQKNVGVNGPMFSSIYDSVSFEFFKEYTERDT